MPLSPGHRLGPYEIVAPIGAGGMGEVYCARDTRLDRTVAIKVNAEQFSERFEREARAVAALNHPNICTLFDVGPNYLVMEFIDGQTLDRITPPNGMRLADALKIAVNIAAGLAAAHALGIIHRDLKPGNVMVTAAGVVKLLDFGLAAVDPAALPTGTNDATRTLLEGPKTVQGTILGTVSYMSPEQAEGRKLDTRSDIFSFGSVLYEMVTGQRAFQGETTVSTLAAILNKEPKPAASLVAWLPVDLDRIIARCLRKDPDRRFQHASDLRVELQELVDAQSSGALAAQPATPAAGRGKRGWTPAIIGLALAGGLAGGWFLHRPPPPFQGPTLSRATYDNGLTCDPALSPDGKLLVYASDRAGKGNLDIWVQPAAGGDPVQLSRDEADEYEPSFSPDGSQIVFRSEREGGGVYSVPALGGEARLLAREGRNPRFSPDGTRIAYWTGKGGRSDELSRQGGRIWLIQADGGERRQLASKVLYASTPVWAPDSRTLLFVGLAAGSPPTGAGRKLSWYLTSVDNDQPVMTTGVDSLPPGSMPSPSQWLPSNHIVYAQSGMDRANLYRVAIDAGGKRLTGKPERLTFGGGVEAAPSVGPDGTIALGDLTWNLNIWSLPMDTRNARVTGQPVRVTESLASDFRPSLSADGARMAYARTQSGQITIWSFDFQTGKSTQLVRINSRGGSTGMSPDGSQVLYSQAREGRLALFTIPFSGGISQRILDDSGNGGYWSGKDKIAYIPPGATRNMLVLDLQGKQNRLLLESGGVFQIYFTPDESHITFVKVNTWQTAQIFIARATGTWPIPQSEWIPVTDGKEWDDKPRWSPDGKMIYFTSDRDRYRCIWAQRLDPATRRPAGAPFAVAHFHSARQSMIAVGVSQLELAVGLDKIAFVQGEVTGNVWLANRPQ